MMEEKKYRKKRAITFTTKRKEKRIMISEFFTHVGRLRVFNSVPDYQFFQDKNWPLDENQVR